VNASGGWRIQIPVNDMDRLRHDPQLAALLTLARILNSILYTGNAMLDRRDGDTPSDNRQRSSSFLYSAALMYEALEFTHRAGQHLRQFAAFTNDLSPILRDPDVVELRKGLLRRLRNQAVFHHDDDVIPKGLADLDLQDYTFAAGVGTAKADVFFSLADFVVISFGLGSVPAGSDFMSHFAENLGKVARLEVRFQNAAEKVLTEAVAHFGWKLVQD
jgi:hypothetical protein